ncbi:MAG: hypothetical protein M3R13_10920 [Armatimonadota bacterium]|nr:hypothetical protein [Armatimonadota bacterium]
MTASLWLLAILGVIGAFDTIYYHEWKAKLPAGGKTAAPELRLHAARDFFYAILFGTLPWIAWQGKWVIVLVAVILIEIVLTLWDFIVEIAVRKSLGDVYAGERVTHAIMGIIYGAMVAYLIPTMIEWWSRPTVVRPAPRPDRRHQLLALLGRLDELVLGSRRRVEFRAQVHSSVRPHRARIDRNQLSPCPELGLYLSQGGKRVEGARLGNLEGLLVHNLPDHLAEEPKRQERPNPNNRDAPNPADHEDLRPTPAHFLRTSTNPHAGNDTQNGLLFRHSWP